MQTIKHKRSLRRIKRAIRNGWVVSENTWKSLSAEQMEKAVQYFVFSILRKREFCGAKPDDGFANLYCAHLSYDEAQKRLFLSFKVIFKKDLFARIKIEPIQNLSLFIDVIANQTIKMFGNKRRPVYVRR